MYEGMLKDRSPRSPTAGRFSSLIQMALLILIGAAGFLTLQRVTNHLELTITTVVTQLGDHYPPTAGSVSDAQMCKAPDHSWQDLPALQPITTWRSTKPRHTESVTIVTQSSLERLEALRTQCWIWQDRIAAVIYLPLLNGNAFSLEKDTRVDGRSLESVVRQLASFHAVVDADPEGCALDLELVVEPFYSTDDPKIALYPFNAIRNRALMLAQTEAVVLLDVDFLPSTKFFNEYQDPLTYQTMLAKLESKHALVLPAFGTADNKDKDAGRQLAAAVAMGGKSQALAAYKEGILVGFQIAKYPPGHTPTNYTKWVTASSPYHVKYQKGYEPYVVMARKYVPWYDERFRGYGWDKITHLMYLARLGIKFTVHPSQFVVHLPHKNGISSKATKATGQYDKLIDLYAEVRKTIANGTFAPVTSFYDVPRLCLNAQALKPLDELPEVAAEFENVKDWPFEDMLVLP